MVQVSSIPPSERYPGRPEGGRIVVIAPTRAACETIELGINLTGVKTVLEEEHGDDVRRLARSGRGFGIVAGTGTGKTLAIRPMAEEIVGAPIRTGVVNREREATPETPTWNVVVVTTGIARRWLQDDLIAAEDTIIVDEIHQTSAELELCLALGKRAGCRFIWLSATVDPSFYADYLDSAEIIHSSAFDPEKAATVRVSTTTKPLGFLNDRFVRHVVKQRRGVAVFVPTRAGTEEIAADLNERWPEMRTEFYHGGEPIAKLRPFLDGTAAKPFVLAMTAAGQSALNIQGLDTVVIEDAQFTTVVRKGKGVLTKLPLGANEILQMAGRVHGRVANGEVWILSERDIRFEALEPTAPNFQLAGDPERVAMTCADVGVRADELELPVPLDRAAYRRALQTLEQRGLIRNGRLTEYGRKVEVLPVDRPWGELLIQADEQLVPIVATCASIDSLHRMTRAERNIGPFIVAGSDHLTAYQLYRDALQECGSLGTVYGLPRHVFDEKCLEAWGERYGVLVRAIEDAALAVASIYRSLDLKLPRQLPRLNDESARQWQQLLARHMPFDLIIDEETSWGEEVRVSQNSVCGTWGALAGDLRFFSDRFGRARGSMEGTQIPYDLVWQQAREAEREVVYDPGHRRAPLRLKTVRAFHGFELDSEEEGIDEFPEGVADQARQALAEALAAGAVYHSDARANRTIFRQLRDVYRRSGGTVPEVGEKQLAEHFRERLAGVGSYKEFLDADLALDPDQFIPAAERERWEALPDSITLAGEEYPLDYAMEGEVAVARARVPAKVLPQISEKNLPELDRPLHWTVIRGKRDAVRAASLDEARMLLQQSRSDRAQRERRAEREQTESGGTSSAARTAEWWEERKGRGRKQKTGGRRAPPSGGGRAQQETRGGGSDERNSSGNASDAGANGGDKPRGQRSNRRFKPRPPRGGGGRGRGR